MSRMSSFAPVPPSSVVPLRLGVTFRPARLLLLYRDDESAGVTRRLRLPLRSLGRTSDCYAVAQELRRRHLRHLGAVPAVRIEKFLRLLQETMGGSGLEEALEAVKKDFALDLNEDMNKLSDRDLSRRKEIMEINFAKNQIRVGDPDFVWDKKVEPVTMRRL